MKTFKQKPYAVIRFLINKNLWLGLAVTLLAFCFMIWPYAFNVILMSLDHYKYGLRVETTEKVEGSFHTLDNFQVPTSQFFLRRPNTTANAYGVWNITRSGRYSLYLVCKKGCRVTLDSNRVSFYQVGLSKHMFRADIDLDEGPHFLAVRITSKEESGWFKLTYTGPGVAIPRLIQGGELIYIELGNVGDWHDIIQSASHMGMAGAVCLGIFSLLWLAESWRGIMVRRRLISRNRARKNAA